MNNKAAIGLVAAIIILVGAFFLFNKPVTAPVVLTQTATTSPTASSTPTVTPVSAIPTTTHVPAASPSMQVISQHQTPRITAVDTASLTSSAPRPIVTGTANVKSIGIVLDNPAGVGIEGASNIPVTNGHWTFAPAQALPPGTYTLHIIGGDTVLVTKLNILAQ
ncbi:MAG: hypothetical protein JWO84_769 [Parcubacteria group bacterium]|nr:hypothetical protein [Parcubacteria group bacterium]